MGCGSSSPHAPLDDDDTKPTTLATAGDSDSVDISAGDAARLRLPPFMLPDGSRPREGFILSDTLGFRMAPTAEPY